MIVYPDNYRSIGQPVPIERIEEAILQVLTEINCNCISLSGGLDSSLMLYYMSQVYHEVLAITIGCSEKHPDVRYAKLAVSQFDNVFHEIYIPSSSEISNLEKHPEDFDGDSIVRLFYAYVKRCTDSIVACDGIDEFMCGYYAHQELPCEATYYDHLRKLRDNHLIPLHRNSKDVKVYLPYLDERLLTLYSQIPVRDKVDMEYRKKILVEMAKGKVPDAIIGRRKYGFLDALGVK
jgi:asparagine synthetase B (glutamine-hydrolysing)